MERLAGAPISWGACEVPDWGEMPAAERVLAEMASLGLRGTELGAPGFLPRDPIALGALLAEHDLSLVGGFLALTLHEPRIDHAIKEVRETASLFAEVGGEVIAFALVPDADWSTPGELDDQQWRQVAENLEVLKAELDGSGITLALHPHFGTLVQSAGQIERALAELDVPWCLDTGHLRIAGIDPAAFARSHGDRVVHVHLKDVDGALAAELWAGKATLASATRQGLFLPLGEGDAAIGAVLAALNEHGYGRWLVLEQDSAITGDEPAGERSPMQSAKHSIDYLENSAPTTLEVNS